MFFRPPRKRARIATSRRWWLLRCGLRRIETKIYTGVWAGRNEEASELFIPIFSKVKRRAMRTHEIFSGGPHSTRSDSESGDGWSRGEDGLSRLPKLKSKTFTRRRCNLVCRPSVRVRASVGDVVSGAVSVLQLAAAADAAAAPPMPKCRTLKECG